MVWTNPGVSDGNATLFFAAWFGHIDAVRLLLDHGADPNTRFVSGQAVLSPVYMHGFNDMLRLLPEAGAEPVYAGHEDGETPLMIAVGNGHYIVRIRRSPPGDPNVRDRKGNTALRYAPEAQQTEIAELLKRHGAVQ